MADSGYLYGDDYDTHFDPDVYVKSYFTVLDESVLGGFIPFVLRSLHDIFKTGNVKGKRLLEIGTTPIPFSVLSALPFVEDVYLAEFASVNRKYLHDALFGSGVQDYSAVHQFVADLQGDSADWRNISDALKSKVRGIFPCDLLQTDMFLGCLFPPLDIVTVPFAMDAAAPDLPTYKEIARKVSVLLRYGGHLIIVGVLNASYYCVGKHKFYSFSTSEAELKDSWREVGFTIKDWYAMESPKEYENSDYGIGFVMHCVKT